MATNHRAKLRQSIVKGGDGMADITWPITSVGIAVVIVLIGILMVWRIRKDQKSGFPSSDERTKRITEIGRAHV